MPRKIPDEKLIEDIQEVAKKLNAQTMTVEQYNEHGMYWETTCSRRFGSWNNALEKAGLKASVEKNISDECFIEDLQRVAKMLDTQTLITTQYAEHGKYSADSCRDRFGSWSKAMKKAGLSIAKEMNISDEELIEDLQTVARVLNAQTLTIVQYNEHGIYSSAVCQRRFVSWNNALKKAGLTISREKNIDERDLIEDLQRVAKMLGAQRVTREQYEEHGKYSIGPYSSRFGSWNDALSSARLEKKKNISDKDLTEDLQRVAKNLDVQTLTSKQYDEYGKYSSGTYRSRFGSWNKALKENGLSNSVERNIPNGDLFQDLQRVAKKLDVQVFTCGQYEKHGNYSVALLFSRFGSWKKTLQLAGLKIFEEDSISLTMELLLPHADILSRVLRCLRSEHEDLSSDDLWLAIKTHWSEQDLLDAVEAFQSTEDLSAFRSLLSR